MLQEISTPAGKVRIGSEIHIESVFAKTAMLKDGIDKRALEMQGKTGTVEYIDEVGMRGTWGTLSVLFDVDKFTIVKY